MMRKKYSDPLMFPSLLLTIPIDPKQSIQIPPDEEWGSKSAAKSAGIMMNSASGNQAVEKVIIADPAKEEVNNYDAMPEESSSTELSESLSMDDTVINQIVPEETDSSVVTE